MIKSLNAGVYEFVTPLQSCTHLEIMPVKGKVMKKKYFLLSIQRWPGKNRKRLYLGGKSIGRQQLTRTIWQLGSRSWLSIVLAGKDKRLKN